MVPVFFIGGVLDEVDGVGGLSARQVRGVLVHVSQVFRAVLSAGDLAALVDVAILPVGVPLAQLVAFFVGRQAELSVVVIFSIRVRHLGLLKVLGHRFLRLLPPIFNLNRSRQREGLLELLLV